MEKNKKITIGIGILIGIVIISITAAKVSNGSFAAFDTVCDSKIIGLRMPGLNILVEMFTYTGNWQSVVIACLLLLAYDSTRKSYGIPVTAVALVSSIANRIIKHIMMVPRPDASNMLIEQGGYSFPSGHTATFTALMLMLIVLLIKNKPEKFGKKSKAVVLGISLVVLSFLMGFSRIYLGVHHTSDVFAGWFVGFVSFCVVILMLEYLGEKSSKEK